MTLQRRRPPRARHRVALLAAALTLIAAAFLAGYISGNSSGDSFSSGKVISLVGTKAAPGALASLRVEPVDPAGNWPMKLSVTGLAKLPATGYYTVYLMRDGKVFAPCGTFVSAGKRHAATVWLNAPYRLKPHDTWVITRQMPGHHHEAGTIVMRPNVNV
jgi:hypothetical protein